MKVKAVIVTYHPQIEELEKLCTNLVENKADVIIVDNSENSVLGKYFLLKEHITGIPLHYNSGIAHAQNIGIREALNQGADVVVFFDQDSKISIDFLPSLLKPISKDAPVVVGPVFFDAQKGYEYPSFRFNKIGLLKKVYKNNNTEPYPVDVIISSGSAVTKEVFTIAGFMDEDLFIDFVDIEWAIRCKQNNIPIKVIPSAIMNHTIGITSVDMGGMKGYIHSPYRTYYKIRNPFLLLRKNSVPILLSIKEIFSALLHEFFHLFYVNNRRVYLKNILVAVKDGILNIRGKRIG
jgi:rhamnosyltransferase